MAISVKVEGLREYRRALRSVEGELKKAQKKKVKEAAEIVASEARARAPVKTGRLKGSIKAYGYLASAKVRVNAKKRSKKYSKGYPYGRVIEFARHKRDAFLYPALEAKREAVYNKLQEILEEAVKAYGS